MANQFEGDAVPAWGLYVDEQRRDLTARKSIKVKLPIRQHIKLHALKLFSENNISQTVEHALDIYFEQMRQQELAARLAAQDAGAGAGDGSGPGGPGADGPGDGGNRGTGATGVVGASGPSGPRGPGPAA